MKPISNGFSTSERRINLEDAISNIDRAKMRFFVRSPHITFDSEHIARYFPPGTVLDPIPAEKISSPLPTSCEGGSLTDDSSLEDLLEDPLQSWNDPFIKASVSVDALRISYLAPAIHFNHYLDWLLFDAECEQGLHQVDVNDDRPSNIARRVHFEAFAHSVLIALKSALDRLVAVVGQYVPGISNHMTWGRIKDGKPSNFMSIVVKGQKDDELLAFLYTEYQRWIERAVAPRDEIIHYADLHTTWGPAGWSGEHEGYMAFDATHASVRDENPATVDLQTLHNHVTSFYTLAERVLLTLATRLPWQMQKRSPSLGSLIVQDLGVPPGKRVGELKKAIELAIEAHEVAKGLPVEAYIDFLRRNAGRFGLVSS